MTEGQHQEGSATQSKDALGYRDPDMAELEKKINDDILAMPAEV
jgi:hypothetical protein